MIRGAHVTSLPAWVRREGLWSVAFRDTIFMLLPSGDSMNKRSLLDVAASFALIAIAATASPASAQEVPFICSSLPGEGIGCYITYPYLFIDICGGHCCVVCVDDPGYAYQQCHLGIGDPKAECPDGVPPQGTVDPDACSSTPSCWSFTQYNWNCPFDPRPGSVIEFEVTTTDCGGQSEYNWTVCDGEELVQVLDPLDPPNATSTLRLKVLGSGTLIVSGHVLGSDYYLERRVEINASCSGDIDGNGFVNNDDLFILLGEWSPNQIPTCQYDPMAPQHYCCAGDLDVDGDVDNDDLFILLAQWGSCP
jgi:hypothetical protein